MHAWVHACAHAWVHACVGASQVPDSIFNVHGACGFRFATDEKEFFVYAESASVASRWVAT